MLNCTHEEPNGTSPHSYVDSLTGVGLRGCSRREMPSMRATVTAPRTMNTSTVANSVSIRVSLPLRRPDLREDPAEPDRGLWFISLIIGDYRLYTIDTIRYS